MKRATTNEIPVKWALTDISWHAMCRTRSTFIMPLICDWAGNSPRDDNRSRPSMKSTKMIPDNGLMTRVILKGITRFGPGNKIRRRYSKWESAVTQLSKPGLLYRLCTRYGEALGCHYMSGADDDRYSCWRAARKASNIISKYNKNPASYTASCICGEK